MIDRGQQSQTEHQQERRREGRQPTGLHKRVGAADHRAHRVEQREIDREPPVTDIKGNIPSRIENADEIARQIADKGCRDRALHAVFGDEERIEHQIERRGDKARIEAVFRVLRDRIDAGQKLIVAHEQHRDDQHRRIEIGAGIGRVILLHDQNVGEGLVERDDESRGEREHRLIGVVDLRIEFRAPFRALLGDRAHIPRLIEHGRDH